MGLRRGHRLCRAPVTGAYSEMRLRPAASRSRRGREAGWGFSDFPYYTRPASFRDWEVPEVLLSGNHEQIRRWRRRAALIKTRGNRPDLLETADLSEEDQELLAENRALTREPGRDRGASGPMNGWPALKQTGVQAPRAAPNRSFPMMNKVLKKIYETHKREEVPELEPGDTVRVQVKIREGDKERLQAFEGVLIARNNTGLSETITVRKDELRHRSGKNFPAALARHRQHPDRAKSACPAG